MAPNSFTHGGGDRGQFPPRHPDLPPTFPFQSEEADSSSPETLNEVLTEGPVYNHGDSSSPGFPRLSTDSLPPNSNTAAKLAELRKEMKANKQQIQALTQAYSAVQSAASEISSTQEMLNNSGNSRRPVLNSSGSAPQRGKGTRTQGKKNEDIDQPEEPERRSTRYEQDRWVDQGYYEGNPWYDQPKDKPVYSLGKTLPHTMRSSGQKKDMEEQSKNKDEVSAAEEGQAGPKNKNMEQSSGGDGYFDEKDQQGPNKNQQQSSGNNNDDGGDSRNENDNHQDREDRGDTEPGDKYKVDKDPMGGESEDKLARDGKKNPSDLRNWWARFRAKYPEPLAEFLATGMSIFLGISATLTVNLSKNQENQYGTYETSCWAWGFAFMFGIYIGGGVSGAHMSPAISISLSLFRGFPWRQCALYIVVQFAASMCAAGLAYAIYYDALHYVDPAMETGWKSFFSYPQEWVSDTTAFCSQVVAGAVMMIAVFALGDDQNNPPGVGMHAFILGMLQTTLKFSLGYNTGSALNPASDFGPRLVAWAVGYRTPKAFSNTWWIYGPWGGAMVGSITGCLIYDLFIFVGSESPINYKMPGAIRTRTKKMFSSK
ncbi:aquaporin-like protein [Apiospora arundinis]|uniref:Aquaporin-like protein n=1 Tax=Apiospora arundinis TaxID=335852 RepID=A0ABR2IWW6_9PEZI